MRRFVKIAFEKPEIAALLLLLALVVLFQELSDGFFLNANNLRGVLGLLPEMALIAIGETLVMICGEFDLSVGSVFALMPMTMAVLMAQDWPFVVAMTAGFAIWPSASSTASSPSASASRASSSRSACSSWGPADCRRLGRLPAAARLRHDP